MEVTFATSKEKANFPYVVECKNTENWNTDSGFKTLAEAKNQANYIANLYPNMPVRVLHYTGGPM